MKPLYRKNQFRSDDEESHSSDIDRIVKVAKDNEFELSRTDAKWIWDDYSESFAAGWLGMNQYSDTELWYIIDYRMTTNPNGETEDDE